MTRPKHPDRQRDEAKDASMDASESGSAPADASVGPEEPPAADDPPLDLEARASERAKLDLLDRDHAELRKIAVCKAREVLGRSHDSHAELLADEALLKVRLTPMRRVSKTGLRGYVRVAVRNRCLTFLGEMQRRATEDLDAVADSLADLEAPPDDQLATGQLIEMVRRELAESGRSQALAIMDRLVDDPSLRPKDIAEELGLAKSTVSKHYKRIRGVVARLGGFTIDDGDDADPDDDPPSPSPGRAPSSQAPSWRSAAPPVLAASAMRRTRLKNHLAAARSPTKIWPRGIPPDLPRRVASSGSVHPSRASPPSS